MIAALGFAAFAVGRSQEHTVLLLIGLVGAAGLATSIGFALVSSQYRLLRYTDVAGAELLTTRAELSALHERTRSMVHDARSTVAALGATLHTLERSGMAPDLAERISIQLGQLRDVLNPTWGLVAPVLLMDLMEPVHAFANAHAIELEVDVDPQASVLADPPKVGQILINLLDNARKYALGSEVRIGSRRTGPFHRITVEDGGPGLADDVDLLFSPGTRTAADAQGFGMGLASSRFLAESMGGALWYERAPDGGSRFVLRLPAADPAPDDQGGAP